MMWPVNWSGVWHLVGIPNEWLMKEWFELIIDLINIIDKLIIKLKIKLLSLRHKSKKEVNLTLKS